MINIGWEIVLLILIIIVLLLWIFLRNVTFSTGIKEEEIKQEEEIKEEIKDQRKFASVGEKLCCLVYEEYVKKKVKNNVRPSFLKNPKTNHLLQYDVYDEENKLAIEYNGEQHYIFPNKWIKDIKEFEESQYRDKLKEKLSKNNGIFLIVVPYTVDTENKKRLTHEQRKKRIENFLIPILNSYFSNV